MKAQPKQKPISAELRAKSQISVPGQYLTGHELEWIDALGTHSPIGISRAACLDGYLIALHKRNVWGRMDKLEIMAYAVKSRAACQ
jgi:hypothetical protein